MWRFTFSAILLVFSSGANAQAIPEDLLPAEQRAKFAPRSFQINYNLLKLGENVLDKPRNSQEVQVEAGFHKFFLVADFGNSQSDRGEDYSYHNDGKYWRLGIDANLSKNWQDGNVIALGLRYAEAEFTDDILFTRTLPTGTEELISYSNDDLSARWAELVFKMRAKVWKNLYTGYTMRYQFYELVEGVNSELKPFDIPGYGKTTKPNSFGFDYYVGWRIGF